MLHLSQKRTSSSPQLPDPTANADSTSIHSPPSPETDSMISTITAQRISASAEPLAHTKMVDVGEQADNLDSRSSSLSEIDDTTEERNESNSKEGIRTDEMEGDSEAETELLTPRKPNSGLSDPNGALQTVEKSPSKLTQEISVDFLTTDVVKSTAEDGLPPSSNLSMRTSSPSPSKDAQPSNSTEIIEADIEQTSRKRKRSTSLVSSLSEMDEPLAKRSHSSKHEIELPTSPVEGPNTLEAEVEEQSAQLGQKASLDDGVIAQEANVEDEESVATPVPVVSRRGGWPRKGKLKGGKKGRKPFIVHESDVAADSSNAMAEDETAAADAEAEEEGSSGDGERKSLRQLEMRLQLTTSVIAKKKAAMDMISGIEKDLTAFRERYVDVFDHLQTRLTHFRYVNEQLVQVNRDLDLLERNVHPIFLAQLKCLDEYRDEKIRYETVNLRYRQQALATKTVAERTQLHSQFFQDVRKERDEALEKCYKDYNALQKDRRRWGSDETNCNYLYNPKRSQQIQQQASYNLEVSILSGIAKHVGFPAAPDINGLPTSEIEADFQAMTVSQIQRLIARARSQAIPDSSPTSTTADIFA